MWIILRNKRMIIVYLYLNKYNPKSASKKSNESLPGAQIHMPIKPVKHKM